MKEELERYRRERERERESERERGERGKRFRVCLLEGSNYAAEKRAQQKNK